MSSTSDEYENRGADHTQRIPQSERARADAEPYRDDHRGDTDAGYARARDVEGRGGIKWGAAFFGWLAAVGTGAVLATLVAAVGAIVDTSTGTDLERVTDDPAQASVVGLVAVAFVLMIIYVSGGYVAGRMARFDGGRQGVGVWVWTLVMGAVTAALSFVLGRRFDVVDEVPGVPSAVPLVGGDPTVTAALVLAGALLIALVSAVAGGKMGMRYHRIADRYDDARY